MRGLGGSGGKKDVNAAHAAAAVEGDGTCHCGRRELDELQLRQLIASPPDECVISCAYCYPRRGRRCSSYCASL